MGDPALVEGLGYSERQRLTREREESLEMETKAQAVRTLRPACVLLSIAAGCKRLVFLSFS